MQPEEPSSFSYSIKSQLADGQMFVTLEVYDHNAKQKKLVKVFAQSFCDQTLSEDVKKNFKDIANVHSILNQTPESCKVNTDKGVITLLYEVMFRNGKKLELEGILQLQQMQLPQQQKINESVEKKFEKLQSDIKQLQELFESDTKIKQQQIQKISKDIVEDVEQLKQRYEQFKYWKNQQQIKNKQFQHFHKISQNSQMKQNRIQLSDEIMHFIEQRLNQQKQNYFQKFQKQAEKIQQLKSNSAGLRNTIDKICQENLQLKKVTKSFEQSAKMLVLKNQALEAQVGQLVKSQQKVIKYINTLEERLPKQASSPPPQKKQKSQHQNPFNKPSNQGNPEQVLRAFFSGGFGAMTSPKAQNNNSSINLNKTFSSTELMQIHPSSAYSKQFIHNNKTITYNGATEDHTQLIGNLKVDNQRLSFVSVIKTKRNEIGFGVIDLKYLNQRNSLKNPNCIMLCAANGALYDGGVYINSDSVGFKQGDKVKMRINPIQGFIQFSIDGTVVCKHKSQKLKDFSIQWGHFIRLCDKGDTIKWTLQ